MPTVRAGLGPNAKNEGSLLRASVFSITLAKLYETLRCICLTVTNVQAVRICTPYAVSISMREKLRGAKIIVLLFVATMSF